MDLASLFTNGRIKCTISIIKVLQAQIKEGSPMNEKENALAVFIDFENLALGFKHKKDRSHDDTHPPTTDSSVLLHCFLLSSF